MQINFILPFKRMSGGIRVVYIYANYLVEKGHDVCCYVPMVSYKGKNQNLLYRLRASISNTLKKENWFDCKFSIKIVPRISNRWINDADVTIATAWQTAYDVKKLAKNKGKKFYFVQDYEVFNGSQSEVEGSYKLEIPLITISDKLKNFLKNFNSSVDVVRNGLFDDEYIQGEKKYTPQLRILMMYHEAQHKGSEEALNIIEKLENAIDIKVTIFGRKIDEKLAQHYEVYENPSRIQLMKLYQESDIYLFNSTIEAWGLPIVEAMANKCVVIGRKLGALEELYDGYNAIIVSEVEQYVSEIENMSKDKDRLRLIQEAAYATARKLNWSVSANLFEKIISENKYENDF